MPHTLEIGMVAHNDRYDDDDPRWLVQAAPLVLDLRRDTGSARLPRAPAPGTKGAVDQLILSLGSAGALSAAVRLISTWLRRDRHRSVELTFTDAGGNPKTLRVSAENAGSDAFAPLVMAASEFAAHSRSGVRLGATSASERRPPRSDVRLGATSASERRRPRPVPGGAA